MPLKRVNPAVHLLIKGDKGSQLLKKAFPLAEKNKPLTLQKALRGSVYTATGKQFSQEPHGFDGH